MESLRGPEKSQKRRKSSKLENAALAFGLLTATMGTFSAAVKNLLVLEKGKAISTSETEFSRLDREFGALSPQQLREASEKAEQSNDLKTFERVERYRNLLRDREAKEVMQDTEKLMKDSKALMQEAQAELDNDPVWQEVTKGSEQAAKRYFKEMMKDQDEQQGEK